MGCSSLETSKSSTNASILASVPLISFSSMSSSPVSSTTSIGASTLASAQLLQTFTQFGVETIRLARPDHIACVTRNCQLGTGLMMQCSEIMLQYWMGPGSSIQCSGITASLAVDRLLYKECLGARASKPMVGAQSITPIGKGVNTAPLLARSGAIPPITGNCQLGIGLTVRCGEIALQYWMGPGSSPRYGGIALRH
ncbi:hypothetical protein FXO37_16967 [Capsicum annuum]|nr:hypothetical protein FXO37_16967 [Capsicum annuum]